MSGQAGDRADRTRILNAAANHLVWRFLHDDAFFRGQRNERIRAAFHVLNQVGVQHERLATQSRQLDHRQSSCRPDHIPITA